VQAGVHIKIIADRMGHSTVRLMDLYAEYVQDQDRAAAAVMEEKLKRAMGE
jgi:hypothetical protein